MFKKSEIALSVIFARFENSTYAKNVLSKIKILHVDHLQAEE